MKREKPIVSRTREIPGSNPGGGILINPKNKIYNILYKNNKHFNNNDTL